MAEQGYFISQLRRSINPAVELAGALIEFEAPIGPNGEYINISVTTEQLITLLGGATTPGTPSGTRALGDVPTAKALAVVAAYKANGGPCIETDTLYYGQYFIDDFTEPGDVFKYSCDVWRPAAAGQPTVWKWGRYLEAGV